MEGEAPTKYFFRLAKIHGESQTIDSIVDRHGRESRNDRVTLDKLTDYYESLFTPEPIADENVNHFIGHIESRMSASQAMACDSEITLEE